VPLVGFICSINENRKVSFDECLDCALHRKRKSCHFSYEILYGIIAEHKERDPNEISVTALLGCLRNTYLTRHIDYYDEPAWYAFRGTMAHHLIEKYPEPGAIYEKQFSRVLELEDGQKVTITGRVDKLVPDRKEIWDFKTTNDVPVYNRAYTNHTQQLNSYRWLAEEQYEIETLKVQYLSMAKPKRVPAKLWSMEETVAWLQGRVSVLLRANQTGIAPPEEICWQCSPTYCSVMAECRKLVREEWYRKGWKAAIKEVKAKCG